MRLRNLSKSLFRPPPHPRPGRLYPLLDAVYSATDSTQCVPSSSFFSPSRSLAQLHPERGILEGVAFRPSWPSSRPGPELGQHPDAPKPDPRTLKLGSTLRILQARLPTLLASPLPQEILSPHISLHLFPSTHPHLPTVSGRVAYHAALWTSPITWGRVPLVGNVNLDILSERMVKNRGSNSLHQPQRHRFNHHQRSSRNDEKLIVRWRTCGKTKGLGLGARYKGIGAQQRVDKITEWLAGDERNDEEEFCGLFIFEFDEEGRISSHVIERAEGGEGWDSGVGRVVGLTDWLLGRFGGAGKQEKEAELVPGLAMNCWVEEEDGRKRITNGDRGGRRKE